MFLSFTMYISQVTSQMVAAFKFRRTNTAIVRLWWPADFHWLRNGLRLDKLKVRNTEQRVETRWRLFQLRNDRVVGIQLIQDLDVSINAMYVIVMALQESRK